MSIVNGTGLLKLSPIEDMHTEKLRDMDGVSYGLAEVGYDIRLKQAITFYPKHESNGDIWEDEVVIDGRSKEGLFALGSTIERFTMPKSLVGIVHDKSTWARRGLSVFNTVIEPGWNGFLTLELAHRGKDPLVIPAGSGIAQVIFHRIPEEAAYSGAYQDQEDKPVESTLVTGRP